MGSDTEMEQLQTRLAVLEERIANILENQEQSKKDRKDFENELKELIGEQNKKFVTKEELNTSDYVTHNEFEPVKLITYGLVTLCGSTILVYVLGLVLR